MKVPKYLLQAIRCYFENHKHTIIIDNLVCKNMFPNTQTKKECLEKINQACIRGHFGLIIMPGCVWISKNKKTRLYTKKNFWIGRPVKCSGALK